MTLGTVLASGVAAGGNRQIITHGGMRFGYPELDQRVRRLGAVLCALGVSAGTRVAMLDRDTHRYLEAYFAVPMLGAVLMTANIRLSAQQLRYTLEHSGTRLVLAAAELVPLLKEAFAGAAVIPELLVMGEDGQYDALMESADASFEFPDVDEESVATHFYTTGTTGLPKGVTYTHRQLVEHTLAVGFALAAADDYQSLRQGDVYMPLTPMFHVHAWGMPYIATLLGLKQVYPGRYDALTLPGLIATERVTFSHCVPTVLQMVLDEAERQGQSLHGWKVMVGGSAMAPALARRAMKSGLQPFAGYGMSETCPVLCFARTNAQEASAYPERLCRVGHPVPLVQLQIEGEDRQPDATEGELVARASWLTQAYFDDPTGSGRLWEGGHLHTGDVATIDMDGAVRIVDRLKDVIKSGGEWVSSLDLEAKLREHPAVDEAAVIGIPDAKWGERPWAFVKLAAAAPLSAAEAEAALRELLQSHVAQGLLPRFAIPERIEFVDELPKTSVGKLDKKRLRLWTSEGDMT
ncbi:long-chain-fatty-acid--CoA ligase [Alicycliphilus denitrificans]|uniref:long-chain-fatty-acid--CoA ligase n=1 Tax=Alicycliphilus denitrificans TaxID=179636 RepID=UPI001EE641F3|nr:long-chain-fatty-acid--CoA ligase [Alicycliphilus denitrificans]